MDGKKGGVVLAVMLGLGLLLSPVLVAGGIAGLLFTAAGGADFDCYGGGVEGGDSDLTGEQRGNVDAIVERVKARGLGAGDAVIAVMVADTESSLVNVAHGDMVGPDSRGLFQQRDPWGPLAVRMDPGGATDLFLNALTDPALKVYRTSDLVNATDTSRAEVAPWLVGQSVQRSAFADGSNYRKKYERAIQIVASYFTAEELAGAGTGRWSNTNLDGLTTAEGGTELAAFCEGSLDVGNGTSTVGGAGAWGGHGNGKIPDEALCPIPWAASQRLRCDAVDALTQLNESYKGQFGSNIAITDSYRSYAEQVAVKASKGWLAATPGTSNHGWGLALDLSGGINKAGTTQYQWMRANAPSFGWDNPTWARPGGSKPEAWHWEYGK